MIDRGKEKGLPNTTFEKWECLDFSKNLTALLQPAKVTATMGYEQGVTSFAEIMKRVNKLHISQIDKNFPRKRSLWNLETPQIEISKMRH